MAKCVNKKSIIDPETGEVLSEKIWVGYDGFTDTGYRYRPKSGIRYFFDSLPANFDQDTWTLLMLIAEIMNENNLLIYRVLRKSKFSNIVYKPMDKDDIRTKIRYPYGINRFNKCWRELTKKVIKKVKYENFYAWAVDPSIISKSKEIPYWLYEIFQDSINPHLSATALKKIQNRLDYFNRPE